jgi:hypothetical protein
VIKDVRSKAGVTFPDEWMVNNDINFSHLAMLGHILFLLPEEAMTGALKQAAVTYVKSIGGVANIKAFTAGTILEGKDTRQAILLKWSKMLSGFDVRKYRTVLATHFPGLVKDSRGIFARIFGSTFSLVTWPVRIAAKITASVTSTFGSFIKLAAVIFVMVAIGSFMARYFLPHTLTILSGLGLETKPEFYQEAVMAATARSTRDAFAVSVKLAAKVPVFLIKSPTYAVSAVRLVMTTVPFMVGFATEAVSTNGANVLALYTETDIRSLASAIQVFIISSIAGFLEEIYSLFTGRKVKMSDVLPGARSDAIEALGEDLQKVKVVTDFMASMSKKVAERAAAMLEAAGENATNTTGSIDGSPVPSPEASDAPAREKRAMNMK